MKKISLIIFTVSLNAVLFSCSNTESLIDEQKTEQKQLQSVQLENCCGEEEDIIIGPPESDD